MSDGGVTLAPPSQRFDSSGVGLASGLIGLAVLAAILAATLPIAFSMAIVFLFAGPHNWFETRYMLGRLPARAGKLWPFFTLAFVGIVGLTASFALLTYWAEASSRWLTGLAVWNTALVLWIATLVEMRSRQNPRHDWGWIWPASFLVIAGIWSAPLLFNLAIVYLHPLMALWLLDRELVRSRPQWRAAYYGCLLTVPLLLVLMVWHLADSPSLLADDPLTEAILYHAGAGILTGVSTHLLVAIHTFLEMVHYSIWLIAIPYIGLRSAPWQLHTIPVARRSEHWKRGIAAILIFGVFISLILWICFLGDYSTTRQIYFTVALMHVLAEIPFLLRSL